MVPDDAATDCSPSSSDATDTNVSGEGSNAARRNVSQLGSTSDGTASSASVMAEEEGFNVRDGTMEPPLPDTADSFIFSFWGGSDIVIASTHNGRCGGSFSIDTSIVIPSMIVSWKLRIFVEKRQFQDASSDWVPSQAMLTSK